jgi:hypothetical protein
MRVRPEIKRKRSHLPISSLLLAVGVSLFAEINAAHALDCHRKSVRSRPIPLGVTGGNIDSIGHGFCCTGTLGSLVQNDAGDQFILSNSHVLTADGSEIVIQPGLADTRCRAKGGAVADGVDSIPISKSSNTVDAAIASVISGEVDSTGAILNIGNVAAGDAVRPSLNLKVQKMGRTSCLTKGRVAAVEVTVKVKYPHICNLPFSGIATFQNQIQIRPGTFGAPGDSGSLIVTTGHCPGAVGLLFAGSTTSIVANPMSTVLRDFGVNMVGVSCDPTRNIVATASPRPASSANSSQSAKVAAVAAVKRRHEAELLKMPGVVGTGVGESADGRLVIKVFVEKDTQAVRSSVPSSLEGIPVEIEETGPVTAY